MSAEPQPSEVAVNELATALSEVQRFITRYVKLPSWHAEVIVTLWVAATHAVDLLSYFPILLITSPEKE